jgi:phage terminase large subunit-like protein
VDLSCPDWQERLRSGRSLVPDLPLPDRTLGNKAVAVLDKLRLFDVPGTPTMAEAGGEWFRDIVRALFGSLDPATKERLIREVFLLLPKKQNKTTGGALLMVAALLLNQRPHAGFLLTGPVQKTADDAFAAAEGAIALDNVLAKKLHVRDHLKTIIHRETQAKLEIMTFDPDVVTGKKVAGGLIDEIHVLGKMSRAKKAMTQLRGGMLPFPEAFLFSITTQSDEAPAGVFLEDLKRARDIRDGKRTGDVLPVLYEFPVEMQTDPMKPWRDPQFWPMVTPNLGRSIQLAALKRGFVDEEQKGEAALRLWASQHLNIEIGVAMQAGAWAGAEYWQRQARPKFTLDELLERCEVVTVGIDGGGLDDLLGLAVLGRDAKTGEWVLWTHAWAHPSVMERRKDIAERLRDFAAEGDLTLVAEIGDDVEEVAGIVAHCYESGLLDKIGVDPAGIGMIADAIVAEGVPQELIIGISQGWKMTGAIKTAERKLAEGTFIHGGQGLMAWCAGNAKIEPRGNAVIITKQASGSAKVDPLLATLDAVHLMSMNPEARGTLDDALANPIIA